MREWIETMLGKLFAVDNTKLGPHDEEPTVMSLSKYDGFVRADDYFDKRIASSKLDGYKVVQPGEWAFSTIHIDEGSIARNNLGEPGVISPMYTTMRFIAPDCLPEYAELLVCQPGMLAEYSRRARGSINRRRSLPFKAFAEIEIALPSLVEQRRIVDVVTAVDEQIEALEAEVDAVHQFCSSRRDDLLSTPDGQQETPLGDVVEVHHGWAFPSSGCREPLNDGLPRLIRIGDFARNRRSNFDPDRSEEFVEDFPEKFLLTPGDLLVVMTCQTPDGAILGWPMLVPTGGPYLHNQRIGRVEVTESDSIDSRYAYQLFRSDRLNRALSVTAAGTKVLHTSPTKIYEVPIYLPTLDEQEQIVTELEAIDANARQCELELVNLRVFRSSLLTSLLNKEIEIPESYDVLLEEKVA